MITHSQPSEPTCTTCHGLAAHGNYEICPVTRSASESITDNQKIDIQAIFVKTPVKITVGGKDYPNTKWNHDVVRKYWEALDPKILSDLKDFAPEF